MKTHTIVNCSACGGTHKDMTVLPWPQQDDAVDCTHWTVCPVKGVNIYIRGEPDAEQLIFEPTWGGA